MLEPLFPTQVHNSNCEALLLCELSSPSETHYSPRTAKSKRSLTKSKVSKTLLVHDDSNRFYACYVKHESIVTPIGKCNPFSCHAKWKHSFSPTFRPFQTLSSQLNSCPIVSKPVKIILNQ